MTMPVHPYKAQPEAELIPRVLGRALTALVLVCLALVAMARLTDRPLEATPPVLPVVAERVIILSGDMSGAARVLDANGQVIAELTPEQGGFISGVYRVLVRERTKHGVALDGPVRLVRTQGNRIAIYDDTTGWSADLMGFGLTNTRAFARLLD
ncbi:photosynthetic complex assembly protein PuhC [Seohaeicola saemankumensis]|uniref:Photosynthetic complex assembly protein PuhC n=1 Tax=Seohaeicola saemankumensis TaxID=481181 RepID=A0ABW3THI5_9RHOB